MISTGFTTTSGRMVDLLDPTAADIDFGDVAEQLAKENRYNGATPGNAYSVAEHTSRGALAVWRHVAAGGGPGDAVDPVAVPDDDYRPAGGTAEDRARADAAAGYFLLHDMPEAYLGDDTTPKKRALTTIAEREFGVLAGTVNGVFGMLTGRFEAAIAEAAGLAWPPPPEIAALVERFDRIMLHTEWRDLRPATPFPRPVAAGEAPLRGLTIMPWGWQRAAATLIADCRRWLPGARR